MRASERGIASAIGALYEASSEGGDWYAAGRELFRLFDVHAGSLRVWQADGQFANILQPTEPLEERYSQYFAPKDPIRAAARQTIPAQEWGFALRTGNELVEEKPFLRSEFYQEFAKPLGRNHLLLGALPDKDKTLLLFFREGRPFGDDDKATLAEVLPHVHRAVQLRQRLLGAALNASMGYAAFEALPGGAVIVDHTLGVLFVNAKAERILSEAGSPLVMRSSTSLCGGRAQLVLRHQKLAPRLQAMVADAASGGSGGALRLEIQYKADEELHHLALLVSPMPHGYAASWMQAAGPAPVLILISELSRPRLPQAAMLADLFGLSTAETAVALALLGGQTAENVARERGVSLETIRSQIRTILRKSEATNLRDFERIGALLATLRQA